MKVDGLTAFHIRIPLRKPIRHASYTRTETDNVLVRAVLEDGTEGFGEGVPREYVTGESVESAIKLLQNARLCDQLHDCQAFDQAVAMTARLHLPVIGDDDRQCLGNAARCAVELALLDAFSRHFRQPLFEVVRLLAPELYSLQDWVRYSGAITSATGWKARLAAWRMRVYGFQHLKVKVGIAGQNDVHRLAAIRRRVGSKTDIRIDANEAWSADEAADRILELERFGITAVEQPVPHEQVSALKDIRRRIHVPIMLDESLCSLIDAERAVRDETCDLFNIRLSKCGGLVTSLKLMQFACRYGIGCQLGCQVGETAVLSAAGRHFAASVRGLRYLEGSYDRHLVKEALATKDITFQWGGWAPRLKGFGLGIHVDPNALARVQVRKVDLMP
ncbi:MAG: dipeptide epimerase [Gemmatales bacterium]|nr:MAG: dipeptide epimerase [Gemmatales bacterium]